MKVSAQYAEAHFADILDAADTGEEVEIARPDKPALFLASRPASLAEKPSQRPRHELFGAWEGLVAAPSQEEWDDMHRHFLAEMPEFSKLNDGVA